MSLKVSWGRLGALGSLAGPRALLEHPWAFVWLLGRFWCDFRDFPGNYGRPFGTIFFDLFVHVAIKVESEI